MSNTEELKAAVTKLHQQANERQQIQTAIDLNKADKTEEALSVLDGLIASSPLCLAAHFNRGIYLQKVKRYHEALAAYAVVIKHKPDEFYAWTNAGDCLNAMGNFEAATMMFKQALAIAPLTPQNQRNLGTAYHNLGQSMKLTGDADKAIDYARKAVMAWPTDPENRAGLGEILLSTGNYSEGWKAYEARFEAECARHGLAVIPLDVGPLQGLTSTQIFGEPLTSPMTELLNQLDDKMQQSA